MININAEKAQKIDQEKINIEAKKYIDDTEWYVKRLDETNTPIPENISQEREAALLRIVE